MSTDFFGAYKLQFATNNISDIQIIIHAQNYVCINSPF